VKREREVRRSSTRRTEKDEKDDDADVQK